MIGRAKKNIHTLHFLFLIVVKKISRIKDNRIYSKITLFSSKREIIYINPKKNLLKKTHTDMHLFGLCCKFFTQMTISFIKIILTLFSYYKVIMNTFHFGPKHLYIFSFG